MSSLIRHVRRLLVEEEAATATEYAVMLAMIVLACMAAVSALGSKVSDVFADTVTEWNNYSP